MEEEDADEAETAAATTRAAVMALDADDEDDGTADWVSSLSFCNCL